MAAAHVAGCPDGWRRWLLGEPRSNWQRAGPQRLAGAALGCPRPSAGKLRLRFSALVRKGQSKINGLNEQQAKEDPSRE